MFVSHVYKKSFQVSEFECYCQLQHALTSCSCTCHGNRRSCCGTSHAALATRDSHKSPQLLRVMLASTAASEDKPTSPRMMRDPQTASSPLQLTLRAGTDAAQQRDENLRWRERALDFREQLLDTRERELDRREEEIRAREQTAASSNALPEELRKLPCEKCRRPGRYCGRMEPCWNSEGFLLHHHHTCTECHDGDKARRRGHRAGRHF